MKKMRPYLIIPLIASSLLMLLPFVWMLSASLKTNVQVFQFPIQWIPKDPQWKNYLTIWTRLISVLILTVKLATITSPQFTPSLPFCPNSRNGTYLAISP